MAAMAPPPVRKGMRLSVKVLALTAENAHGPYRDEAMAAFQEKNLALPVQLDETLEHVWTRIEQRYKENYLSPAQRAAFTIKRLQDAYDCDLDLRDTVGAIFEGETDANMRMIKVVPSFVHRDFSVPVTSKLIPGHVQQARKRYRETSEERASKRQRSELRQLELAQKNVDPARDQPIPSTEAAPRDDDGVGHVPATDRPRRSQSAASLVFVNGGQTGHAEFGPAVKEESPESDLSRAQAAVTAASPNNAVQEPLVPASQPLPHGRQPSTTSRASSEEIPIPQFDDEVPETDHLGSEDVHVQDSPEQDSPEQDSQPVAAPPGLDTPEPATAPSPTSIPELPEPSQPPVATTRRDVYDVPSSPEFLPPSSRPKKTYGRSPHNPKMLQKGADLLNQSRLLSARAGTAGHAQKAVPKSISEKAHAFQVPRPDDIESTPEEADSNSGRGQEDLTDAFLSEAIRQTPNRNTSTQAAKPGSLKKPARKSLLTTPSKARRNVQFEDSGNPVEATPAKPISNVERNVSPASASSSSKNNRLTPKNQARLDSLQAKVRARSLSAKPVATSPLAMIDNSSRQSSFRSTSNAASIDKEASAMVQVQAPEESIERNGSPSQPIGVTTNNTIQPSLQTASSQRTPIRSPVPLPPNVRSATPNKTASPAGDSNTPGNAETFKKPAPKLPSSILIQSQGSHSSDRRSTPLRNEVPLRGSPKQPLKTNSDASIRHLSGSSNSEQVPVHSQVPLPPNMRRSTSTNGSQATQQVNSTGKMNRSNAKLKSSTPVLVSTKRRVRPSEISVSSPTPDPESTSAAQVTRNLRSAKTTPKTAPAAKKDTEQVLVVSSGESSTDYSDSDEEEPQKTMTQDVDVTFKSQASQVEETNGLTKTRNDTVAETDADTQNSQSWDFQGLDRLSSTTDQPNGRPKSGLPEEAADIESEAEVQTKSRSGSAAASTRSSPVVSRAPARFLSHTPTPDASESEDDVEEVSAAPSKTVLTKDESDSESDTSSEEEEEDEDEEDIVMPDVSLEPSSAVVPSSPPPSRQPPPSTPLAPETSQIPSFHNASSQSVSAQASDRRRPTAKRGYVSYKTVTQQLKEVESQPLAQKKVFDPRTQNLTRLLGENRTRSQPVLGVGLEDESEDSKSSSSDSD